MMRKLKLVLSISLSRGEAKRWLAEDDLSFALYSE